ncbi:hypothetical protein V6248_17230 [Pseudoalteromonas agarivorans]|uniref:hypothetical protein n=1 Tax=Pseudoalteromonas agarivorans TaxID=176102 RepID=UPI00311DABF5
MFLTKAKNLQAVYKGALYAPKKTQVSDFGFSSNELSTPIVACNLNRNAIRDCEVIVNRQSLGDVFFYFALNTERTRVSDALDLLNRSVH